MHLLKVKIWDINLLANSYGLPVSLHLGGGIIHDNEIPGRWWIAVHWVFVHLGFVFDKLCFYIFIQYVPLWNFIYRYYSTKDGKVFKVNIQIDNDGCNCSCKRCSHHKLILAEKGLMESGMKGNLENLVGIATQDGWCNGEAWPELHEWSDLGGIWCKDNMGLETWLGQIISEVCESGDNGATTIGSDNCVWSDNKIHKSELHVCVKVDSFDSIFTPKLPCNFGHHECSTSGASVWVMHPQRWWAMLNENGPSAWAKMFCKPSIPLVPYNDWKN